MSRFWTPQREQALADLVAKGWSASQIGDELGCTRNAVIGKVLRGKGRFGALDGRSGRRAPAEARPRPVQQKALVDAPSLAPAELPAEAPAPAAALPPARPISFLQAVDEERCLWFAGTFHDPDGPNMPVCGGERADIPGTRYCLHHLRRQRQDKVAA